MAPQALFPEPNVISSKDRSFLFAVACSSRLLGRGADQVLPILDVCKRGSKGGVLVRVEPCLSFTTLLLLPRQQTPIRWLQRFDGLPSPHAWRKG